MEQKGQPLRPVLLDMAGETFEVVARAFGQRHQPFDQAVFHMVSLA